MANTSRWHRLKGGLKRWQYWVGILGIVITLALAILIVFKWEAVQELAGVSYFGLFVISAFGGATVIIPVPMLAVFWVASRQGRMLFVDLQLSQRRLF